ncbi:hypothetical protein SESBI_01006 [Sesbania bispinosa]|nr:hypothetical protein SESBI_01006 [Sesbania bispinosa]
MVNPSLSKQEMDLIHRSTKKIKVAPPDNTVKHEALKGSPANEQKNSNNHPQQIAEYGQQEANQNTDQNCHPNSDQEPEFVSSHQQTNDTMNDSTSSGPFGPWMLVKRLPKKRLDKGKNGSSDQNSAKRNPGSRFNVLAEKQEDHEEANEKLEIINKHSNTEIQQNHKTEGNKKSSSSSNVKELGKGVGVPKTNKDTNNKLKATGLPAKGKSGAEKGGGSTQVKSQKQKEEEHSYDLQIIKNLGLTKN